MVFFITGRGADPDFEWSSLEGAAVLVHHGSQPMTMFKYACHKAGIDIAKINIIDAGRAFCRAYAATRHYIATTPASKIAAAEKPLFPKIDESVLTHCIHAYQQMGCWPSDMAITEVGYDAMLDIFSFDGKISRRHPYESICMTHS